VTSSNKEGITTMQKESNSSCTKTIVVIAAIASLITIFTFATGIISISQIIGSGSLAHSSTVTLTQNPTEVVMSPIPTSEPSSLPTVALERPQLIKDGGHYRIEQISNGKTGVDVVLNGPSDFPYDSQLFWPGLLVKDIAGNFHFKGDSRSSSGIGISGDGTGHNYELTAGQWMLTQDSAVYAANLSGRWGNDVVYENGNPDYGIIFPVIDGWTTRITIIISRLEIGVLDSTGTKALTDKYVILFCQSKDIAGKPIPDVTCPGEEYGIFHNTEPAGTAVFFVGPGTYYIEVENASNGADYNQKYYYDISISAGEQKRQIINYP
jgi:hypothetical protein